MFSSVSNLKNSLNLYLTFNHYNINYNEIIDFKPVIKNNKVFLDIVMENGKKINVPFLKFKLHKEVVLTATLAVTLASGVISGTVANFKYRINNDNINLSLKNYELNNEETTEEINNYIYENVVKPLNEINYNEIDESEYTLLDAIDETVDNTIELETLNTVNYDDININVPSSNELVRTIDIIGDSSRGIAAYDNIINNYYNDILEYGITYGIDPSIIASLIMEEGGTLYNPNNTEDYYAIGLGCINGSIWNNHTFNAYNYLTNSYESYTINIENLKNNPKEQIKVVALMLQENAITYNGNIGAMLVCYNQGCDTVRRITNQLINSTSFETSSDVYEAANPILISENNTYTSYGNVDYTNRVLTFLDYTLRNETFGRSCASINTPDGNTYTYYVNSQNSLSR